MRNLVMALVLVGCPAGPPSDPPIQWPAPGPFQVDGEQGNVTLVRLDRVENPTTDVFGVFGDNVQGFLNAGACAADFMPCINDEPDFGEVQFLTNLNWRPVGTSEYRWVGDDMLIGPLLAEFSHDPETGIAMYRAGNESRPEGAVPLRFGGEWADVNGVYANFSPDVVFTEPVLEVGERIDLGNGPVTFEWESDGLRDLWLWVQGTPSERFIRIPDTGSYTLNPGQLNLGPAERVELAIAAVNQRSYDIAGNDLDVTVLSGTAWAGSMCGDFPEVEVVDQGPAEEQNDPELVFMAYGFNGIVDEGLRDFRDPLTGELRSAEIYFNFYSLNELDRPELQCTITYDASNAARRPPLEIEGDPKQFATYRVALFNGNNGCGSVDPAVFGSADLRDWIEQSDWSFSIGELVEDGEFDGLLREAFGDEEWATQRDFVHAMYWSQDGFFGRVRGYGYHSDMPTCFQAVPNRAIPAPTEDIEVGYYTSFPYFIDRLPDG